MLYQMNLVWLELDSDVTFGPVEVNCGGSEKFTPSGLICLIKDFNHWFSLKMVDLGNTENVRQNGFTLVK